MAHRLRTVASITASSFFAGTTTLMKGSGPRSDGEGRGRLSAPASTRKAPYPPAMSSTTWIQVMSMNRYWSQVMSR